MSKSEKCSQNVRKFGILDTIVVKFDSLYPASSPILRFEYPIVSTFDESSFLQIFTLVEQKLGLICQKHYIFEFWGFLKPILTRH